MEAIEQQDHFKKLYDAESDAVFRFCFFRTSDREVALDLTQEAFTKMWKVFARGQSPKNERAFLFAITRNLVIDWYRAKKSVSLDALLENEQGDVTDEEPLFTHEGKLEFEMGAEARRLAETIQKLPKQFQQVLYLRFVEDFSPQEIADVMGVSANVVSVRITRGLAQLRELYGTQSD